MASQLTVCLLYSPSTNTVSNTQVLKTFDTGVEQTHLIIHKEKTHVNSVSNVARLNYLRLIGLQKLCFNVRPNYPNAKLCLFLSLSINQYYCSLMWPLLCYCTWWASVRRLSQTQSPSNGELLMKSYMICICHIFDMIF